MTPDSKNGFSDLPDSERLADAFRTWWNLPGDPVEPPNHCRGGMSGVAVCHPPEFTESRSRLYLKRQINHVYRNWQHPICGIPTAAREAQFLDHMQRLGLRVPLKIHFAVCKAAGDQYAVLATEALEGYLSLQELYSDPAHTVVIRDADAPIRLALAQYLAKMHHARLQHGCLYPKHVFVRLHDRPDGVKADIALIDLEKMRWRFSRDQASARDLAQFQRHQEFWPDAAWKQFIREYQNALRQRVGRAPGS